jgi:hypothetical protein
MEIPVTTDEELAVLETQLRRLKIEYEMFFSNPTKRPPTDVEWKVLSMLRKFSDGGRMNFSQRYRYNEMAQRYAIYSDLWRKKSRIREEGYRRPQDALLSVQGVRTTEEELKPHHNPVYGVSHAAAAAAAGAATSQAFTLHSVDQAEREQVERLYNTSGRRQEKSRRERHRQHRLVHHFRSEKNRTDPQAIPLRKRRILRRTRQRPRQTQSQGENLAALVERLRDESRSWATLQPN